MKKFLATTSLLLFTLTSSMSFAANKTITLSIPDMNCPSCPYMVEQSLSRVDGVQAAGSDLVTRTTDVAFDDAIASVDKILRAIVAIGYESSVLATGEGS